MSRESFIGRLIQQEMTHAFRCVFSATSSDVVDERLLHGDNAACVPYRFRQVNRRFARRHQDGGNCFFHSIDDRGN